MKTDVSIRISDKYVHAKLFEFQTYAQATPDILATNLNIAILSSAGTMIQDSESYSSFSGTLIETTQINPHDMTLKRITNGMTM